MSSSKQGNKSCPSLGTTQNQLPMPNDVNVIPTTTTHGDGKNGGGALTLPAWSQAGHHRTPTVCHLLVFTLWRRSLVDVLNLCRGRGHRVLHNAEIPVALYLG
jgi:hypothetical protein